jgi:mannose-6-phosphate isomerase-like protein (cupin superfamily)
MYHTNQVYPWHYQMNQQMNNQMHYQGYQQQYSYPQYVNQPMYQQMPHQQWKDSGPNPFVINIEQATLANNNFRTALWTGKHLQLTLMNINVGEDIGLEIHPNLDQFIRIEQGQGIVQMGDEKNRLTFQRRISDDYAIIIPAGKWHNITNTGNTPLKLYSIYAPPQHPRGTIHKTKAEALAAEENHGY